MGNLDNWEIPGGSKVRDITSGFTGHVTSRTEQLNGCIQYYVESSADKKTGEIKGWNIDVGSLKVLSDDVVKELAENKARLSKITPAPREIGGARQEKQRTLR